MDVIGIIKRSKGAQLYTITRADAAGSYDQSASPGVFVPGATTTLQVWGSVQPATDEDLVALPEGDRTKEAKRFYSFPILQNDQVSQLQLGDSVPIGGIVYQVSSVEHWPNYSKTIVVRVNTNVN